MTTQQADDLIAELIAKWRERADADLQGQRNWMAADQWNATYAKATALQSCANELAALVERVTRQPQEVELLRAIRADASAYQWHTAIDTLADGGSLNGPSRLGASPEDRIQGAKSANDTQVASVSHQQEPPQEHPK